MKQWSAIFVFCVFCGLSCATTDAPSKVIDVTLHPSVAYKKMAEETNGVMVQHFYMLREVFSQASSLCTKRSILLSKIDTLLTKVKKESGCTDFSRERAAAAVWIKTVRVKNATAQEVQFLITEMTRAAFLKVLRILQSKKFSNAIDEARRKSDIATTQEALIKLDTQ